MYHLPQEFQKCKGEVALKHWEERQKRIFFSFFSFFKVGTGTLY